jgi:hypothetical protein
MPGFLNKISTGSQSGDGSTTKRVSVMKQAGALGAGPYNCMHLLGFGSGS